MNDERPDSREPEEASGPPQPRTIGRENEMKTSYTIGKIDELAARLLAMPPVDEAKRQINKQKAIERLAPKLATLHERGYSVEDVAGYLKAAGIEIGKETLTSYLQRRKPRKKKTTSQTAPKSGVMRNATPAPPPPRTSSSPAVGSAAAVGEPIAQKVSHVPPSGGGQLGGRT